MATDWFRNITWNESVQRAFDEKLRRAKRKEQYLRIQASTLAATYPDVALKLLDRYFELPDDFDHAQAYVDRATAFLALGHVSDAMAAYEAALDRESAFPRVLTQAYLELPYLIATRGIRKQYERALQLLQTHQWRLTFPIDHFRWHAAGALIAADSGQPAVARMHAQRALQAASSTRSGSPYHPRVGLVTDRKVVITKLERYAAE